MIKNLKKDELNFVALSKKRQLEQLKNDPNFYLKLKKDLSRTSDLFRVNGKNGCFFSAINHVL